MMQSYFPNCRCDTATTFPCSCVPVQSSGSKQIMTCCTTLTGSKTQGKGSIAFNSARKSAKRCTEFCTPYSSGVVDTG